MNQQDRIIHQLAADLRSPTSIPSRHRLQHRIPYIQYPIVGWGFTFSQNLRSYQNGYRLVSHGAITVLPHRHHYSNLHSSHYPDSELTSPCRILLMPSARLGSDKYQFLPKQEVDNQLIQPLHMDL